jgi:eukaryotic-like serine/threonine-protein kinase
MAQDDGLPRATEGERGKKTAASSDIGSILALRYDVVRELGRGGMGVVYLCRDIVTGERVALKRLRPPDDTKAPLRPEETWWFQQEARAVAALEHPAIVRARDFGSLADGSPYLVMDVLPGRSVHEWMHTTKMPFSLIWSLVDQVLAGLAHAHARGVIHGDMKPSNVMLDVNASDRGPRAYILDLGLAWLRQSRHDPRLDGAPAPELAVHSGAGTVGWVAPEQIRKAATHVGPPTDLYALACIIYRVLTGKEVFAGSAQDVLRAHKRTPVGPLPLQEGTPREVGPFVQRMLAKRPWHRFELAADARRAWAEFRPSGTASLEEIVEASESRRRGQHRAVAAARSLAPGLLALRQAPMVGRDEERAELLRMVDLVCKGTATQRLAVLIGAAGVGKSRLAEWLAEYVHERGLMMPLRARYGRIPTPLDGITGAVNGHYGLVGADHALVEQTLINRWEVAPSDDDALTWVAATAEWLRPNAPGTITPVGPSGKRFILDTPELRWVVVRKIFERISKDRPVLLWFDDLHLASPNTFETISRLQHEASRLGILIVATARSEALETDLDAALRMEAMRAEWDGKVIDLKALAPEDTDELLRSTLPLHEDAVARASEQSRGNPLFALQLVHAWAGGGYLKLEGGEYRVPNDALKGRAITTAELWDERLRAVPTELRLSAYAAAALGEDIRGNVLKSLVSSLGMDAREAMTQLTRAQILLPSGSDQFRWPHALLQEHLMQRLHERNDAAAIFRLAANALAKHPAVGSRRIMKHRVTNLLRAGDDDIAATLMFRFIAGSWRRGRDTTATLRDLELLNGRVTGPAAAEHARWRAEALRHIGRLDEAKDQAEVARRAFAEAGDTMNEAHALRLLGHIASDLGAPAQGRVQVEEALTRFERLGDEQGRGQAQVVLGEIDYLLGDHARARGELLDASARCSVTGDVLGRAQCLILLALTETAAGGHQRARALLSEARAEFERIGYQLGLAQTDVALGHADYRAFDLDAARSHALTARASFRELQNPRGEAACERLLAMVALDSDDFEAASAHAEVARRLFDSLHDPWGELESKLLLAQVALARGDAAAAKLVEACDAIVLDEAEPRQHRHLTRAWLAQKEERWKSAEEEIERARSVFGGDWTQTGDHTPALLRRLSRMEWSLEVHAKLEGWLDGVERSELDVAERLGENPSNSSVDVGGDAEDKEKSGQDGRLSDGIADPARRV